MKIEYSKDVKSNIDLTNEKELKASILGIVKQSIEENHLDFRLTPASAFYKNEIITIIYKAKRFGVDDDFIIITNYRILCVPQSTVNAIIRGEKFNNYSIKDNLLFIDLSSCQDNVYNDIYSLILQYGKANKLIINSDSKYEASFIKANIKPLILKNNDRMVEAYNSLIEKADDLPFDITSIVIDPNEQTLQEIRAEKEKKKKQTINFEGQGERHDDKSLIQNSNSGNVAESKELAEKCHYSFGPAPKGYHQIDVVYAQGPTINWLSNNGNFVKGMQKALGELSSMIKDDEFVCNMRFTTQNMGDTFAVNLAGDLYKKD